MLLTHAVEQFLLYDVSHSYPLVMTTRSYVRVGGTKLNLPSLNAAGLRCFVTGTRSWQTPCGSCTLLLLRGSQSDLKVK